MKLNVLKLTVERALPGFARTRLKTHEGAPAAVITDEQALRRSVLAAMLWDDEFYESGVTTADRIRGVGSPGRAGEGCRACGRGSDEDEVAACAVAAGARDGAVCDAPGPGGSDAG